MTDVETEEQDNLSAFHVLATGWLCSDLDFIIYQQEILLPFEQNIWKLKGSPPAWPSFTKPPPTIKVHDKTTEIMNRSPY